MPPAGHSGPIGGVEADTMGSRKPQPSLLWMHASMRASTYAAHMCLYVCLFKNDGMHILAHCLNTIYKIQTKIQNGWNRKRSHGKKMSSLYHALGFAIHPNTF